MPLNSPWHLLSIRCWARPPSLPSEVCFYNSKSFHLLKAHSGPGPIQANDLRSHWFLMATRKSARDGGFPKVTQQVSGKDSNCVYLLLSHTALVSWKWARRPPKARQGPCLESDIPGMRWELKVRVNCLPSAPSGTVITLISLESKRHGVKSRLLPCCVALGKVLKFSNSPFSHLWNEITPVVQLTLIGLELSQLRQQGCQGRPYEQATAQQVWAGTLETGFLGSNSMSTTY